MEDDGVRFAARPIAERVSAFGYDLRTLPVLLALASIWTVFGVTNPLFLSSRNLSNLSLQIVVTGIIALGLVLILLIGEIDLSVAISSGVMATLMAGLVVEHGVSVPVAIVAAVAAGSLFGAAQGTVVVFGAPSFVVTLGGSLILQGLLLRLLPAGGQINIAETPIAVVAATFIPPVVSWVLGAVTFFGWVGFRWNTYRHERRRAIPSSLQRRVLLPALGLALLGGLGLAVLNAYRGVPLAMALFMALLIVFGYVTGQTPFGTYLYAIGGNADAARRVGIRVWRMRIATFALAGGLAAVAGVVAASRVLGVSVYSGGGTLLLEAIAAAVIGGTSLFGGRGSVWAALLGALVIGSISNGMDLNGVQTDVKLVVEGTILIGAICIDAVIARGSIRPKFAAK